MEHRRFGRSQFDVAAVGFGAWGIGGRTSGDSSYGDTDDSVSRAAIRCAIEAGVDFFDTAPAYGNGHSEYLLGEVLSGADDRIVIATKVGRTTWTDPPNFSPDAIRSSLYSSLKRLGRARVDILWLHSPDVSALLADDAVFAVMDELVKSGHARVWGVSCQSPDDALRILDHRRVEALQVNLNMLDLRAVDCGLLNRATQEQIAIVARTPLCFGFLTGAVDETTYFAKGDHRRAWSLAQVARWSEGARRAMEISGSESGDEACVAALRFCLSFPAVACVLPGALRSEETAVHARAGRLGPLPATQVKEIMSLNRMEEFFVR
jgi:aryl-alcohol dehydrogenase-like predicted oxidoreductase